MRPWTEIQNDPEFQSLNNAQQEDVRKEFLKQTFKDTPGLSPKHKMEITAGIYGAPTREKGDVGLTGGPLLEGVRESIPALLALGPPETGRVTEPPGFLTELAKTLGKAAIDVPTVYAPLAIGGTIAAAPTGPLAPVIGGAGAFGLASAIESAARRQEPLEQLKAAGKGAVIGGIFGGIGGAPASVIRPAFKTAGEIATLGGVSPIIEGRLPTASDVANAAAFIAIMKGATKPFQGKVDAQRAKRIVAKEAKDAGMTPEQWLETLRQLRTGEERVTLPGEVAPTEVAPPEFGYALPARAQVAPTEFAPRPGETPVTITPEGKPLLEIMPITPIAEPALGKAPAPKVEGVAPLVVIKDTQIRQIWDEVISELPSEVQTGHAIKAIKVGEFPATQEGNITNFVRRDKGHHTLAVEKDADPAEVRKNLKHEAVVSYLLETRPELIDKSPFAFDTEASRLIRNLEKVPAIAEPALGKAPAPDLATAEKQFRQAAKDVANADKANIDLRMVALTEAKRNLQRARGIVLEEPAPTEAPKVQAGADVDAFVRQKYFEFEPSNINKMDADLSAGKITFAEYTEANTKAHNLYVLEEAQKVGIPKDLVKQSLRAQYLESPGLVKEVKPAEAPKVEGAEVVVGKPPHLMTRQEARVAWEANMALPIEQRVPNPHWFFGVSDRAAFDRAHAWWTGELKAGRNPAQIDLYHRWAIEEAKIKPAEAPKVEGRVATKVSTREALEDSVRDQIRSAPSYPKLLTAYKRFSRTIFSKGETESRIASAEAEPEVLLTAHASVMNAKSASAKTLESLADAVFKETGLPRKPPGRYRGMDDIDWEQVNKVEQPTQASIARATEAPMVEAKVPAIAEPTRQVPSAVMEKRIVGGKEVYAEILPPADEAKVFKAAQEWLNRKLPETDMVKVANTIAPKFKDVINPAYPAIAKARLETFKTRLTEMELNPGQQEIASRIEAIVKTRIKAAQQQINIATGKLTKATDIQAFPPGVTTQPVISKGVTSGASKLSEIITTLSEQLGVPVRKGYFAQRAAGIYKLLPKVIRLKAGQLETVSHEVGHYLRDTIPELKPLDPFKAELMPLSPKKNIEEGFAEFIRGYIGNPYKIATDAPNTLAYFENVLNKLYPGVKQVLTGARQEYAKWRALPPEKRVESQISFGEPPGQRSIKRWIQTGYTRIVDDLHPIKKYTDLAREQGIDLSVEKDPFALATLLRGESGKGRAFLEMHTFDALDLRTTGEALKPILKEVGNRHRDFSVYLVSRRVVTDLVRRGKETGVITTDAEATVKMLERNNPDFPGLAKRYDAFNDRVLEYLRDSQLIDQATIDTVKQANLAYAPFNRVMDVMVSKGFMGKKMADLSQALKRLKGSEREIIDPLENSVRNTYTLLSLADRNMVGVRMAELASKSLELGRLFERVSPKMAPAAKMRLLDIPEVKRMLKANDIDPSDVPDAVIDIFRPAFIQGNNVVTVKIKGQTQYFQADPELYKAMLAMTESTANVLWKIMGVPARVLRAGATLSPEFQIRNPWRDTWTAFTFSKYNFVPVVDTLRGFFHFAGRTNTYEKWLRSGGAHSMFVSLDRKYLQKALPELLGTQKIPNVMKHPLEVLRAISEAGEAGTRIGEFAWGLGKGATLREAGLASRTVTLDFARFGASTRAMNMITAFWNANVQAIDKLGRMHLEHPYRTTLKALGGITIPTMILYAVNSDDPRYQELPQWQKDLFWIIPTKDKLIRLPKPFELGILYGTTVERAMAHLAQKDPKAFKGLVTTLLDYGLPGFLPTAFVPPIEIKAEYDIFRGRPLLSERQKKLVPEEQFYPTTPLTAIHIGKLLNVSPIKVEKAITGYTAGLGRYGLGLSDILLKAAGAKEVRPPIRGPGRLPVISAFLAEDPFLTGKAKSLEDFYDNLAKLEKFQTTIRELGRRRTPEEQQAFIAEHPEFVLYRQFAGTAQGFSAQLRELTEDLKTIKSNKEQEQRLRRTYVPMILQARQLNEQLKSVIK